MSTIWLLLRLSSIKVVIEPIPSTRVIWLNDRHRHSKFTSSSSLKSLLDSNSPKFSSLKISYQSIFDSYSLDFLDLITSSLLKDHFLSDIGVINFLFITWVLLKFKFARINLFFNVFKHFKFLELKVFFLTIRVVRNLCGGWPFKYLSTSWIHMSWHL